LQDFVELDLPDPEGEEELVKFRKDRARVRRILIGSIKDNLIPYVSKLKKPKEIFDALARLYESKNTSRKMTLRNQLRVTKMNKNDSVATYFMKISQIKDQLIAINEQIDDSELTTLTLNGFPASWRPFVQGICARNKLPKFDKLWADCAQEEARLQSLDDPEDDEDQALTAHSKKGKRSLAIRWVEEDSLIRGKISPTFDALTVTRKVTLPKTVLRNLIKKKIIGSIRVKGKESIMHMLQMIKAIGVRDLG